MAPRRVSSLIVNPSRWPIGPLHEIFTQDRWKMPMRNNFINMESCTVNVEKCNAVLMIKVEIYVTGSIIPIIKI